MCGLACRLRFLPLDSDCDGLEQMVMFDLDAAGHNYPAHGPSVAATRGNGADNFRKAVGQGFGLTARQSVAGEPVRSAGPQALP
jgi:hypothetical protein